VVSEGGLAVIQLTFLYRRIYDMYGNAFSSRLRVAQSNGTFLLFSSSKLGVAFRSGFQCYRGLKFQTFSQQQSSAVQERRLYNG